MNISRHQIETDRLVLREIDAEMDWKPWAEMMGDAQTVKYLWNNQQLDAAGAWANMVMNIGHWQVRGFGFFSVILKETNEWVGRVGPYFPEGWPQAETGWAIHPKHIRNGYASEAAAACLPFVFDVLGWTRVAHVIVDGNAGSIAVAEKIGSSYLREVVDPVSGRKRLIYGQERP